MLKRTLIHTKIHTRKISFRNEKYKKGKKANTMRASTRNAKILSHNRYNKKIPPMIANSIAFKKVFRVIHKT
jgi:hypothetical protein